MPVMVLQPSTDWAQVREQLLWLARAARCSKLFHSPWHRLSGQEREQQVRALRHRPSGTTAILLHTLPARAAAQKVVPARSLARATANARTPMGTH